MRYATSYDVGDRKRQGGINEDSVAVTVFEQGHRAGYRERTRTRRDWPGGGGGEGGPDRSENPNGDENWNGDQDEPEDEDVDWDVAIPANRSAAVFVLADGAGGYEAGDVASYIATTVVAAELAGPAIDAARGAPSAFDVTVAEPSRMPSDADLEAAIGEAIVAAHRAIVADAAESGTTAYTTVVAGIAVGGSLHVGWVGDSRAYIVNRARESIARLTRDHAVVERLREAGEIDEVEALVHPRGNEITRALGGTGDEDPDRTTVDVDTRTVPLYAEDVLLVTSDGLLDAQADAPNLYESYVESGRDEAVAATVRDRAVTDEDLRDVILEAPSLNAAAARFVGLANDRGGTDNVSTLLARDPALDPTPEDADIGARDVFESDPVEERETHVFPEDP